MEIRINLVGSGPKKGQYQLIYYNQYKKRTRIFKKTLEEAQAEKQKLESQQSRVFVETEEYTFGDLYNHYEPVVKKDRRNVLRAINTILDIPAVSLNKPIQAIAWCACQRFKSCSSYHADFSKPYT